MTATIIQFVPKPNPKLIEAHAIEIMNQINHGWMTEEMIKALKAPDKDDRT